MEFNNCKKAIFIGIYVIYENLTVFGLQDYGINNMNDTIACFDISSDNVDSISIEGDFSRSLKTMTCSARAAEND